MTPEEYVADSNAVIEEAEKNPILVADEPEDLDEVEEEDEDEFDDDEEDEEDDEEDVEGD